MHFNHVVIRISLHDYIHGVRYPGVCTVSRVVERVDSFSHLLFYVWVEGRLSIEPELSTKGRVIVEDWKNREIQSFDF